MVKIMDVKITTEYGWDNVRNLGAWSSLKHSQASWDTLLQTTNTGSVIKIEVEVKDPSWLDISKGYLNWNDIKNKFISWRDVKDYNERK